MNWTKNQTAQIESEQPAPVPDPSRSPDVGTFGPGMTFLLWLFCFFIAFPVVDVPVIDVSATFPIFLLIVLLTGKMKEWRPLHHDGLTRLVGWLFKCCVLSVLVSWVHKTGVSYFRDVFSIIYAVYWYFVFVFFRNFRKYYQLDTLASAFLIGSFASSLLILFGTFSDGWHQLGFLRITQNSFALNLVACIGMLSASNIFRRNFLFAAGLTAFFIYISLLSQSRTGGILVFAELCLIMVFRNARSRRALLLPVLALILLIGAISGSKLSVAAGEAIQPVAPRVAQLLIDGGKVNERDKSWLIRQVQIAKGLKLFREYPLFGIGWRHFSSVFVPLDISAYKYLPREVQAYTYTRSAHNTYIQQLAETGIIGMIPLVGIQLWVLWHFLRIFWMSRDAQSSFSLGVSLLGVAVYFWVVSALTGALWYVVLGIFGASWESREK